MKKSNWIKRGSVLLALALMITAAGGFVGTTGEVFATEEGTPTEGTSATDTNNVTDTGAGDNNSGTPTEGTSATGTDNVTDTGAGDSNSSTTTDADTGDDTSTQETDNAGTLKRGTTRFSTDGTYSDLPTTTEDDVYLTEEDEETMKSSSGQDTSYSASGTTVLQGTDASYVFIGDSRTVGMSVYVDKNKYIWSAKSGAGLSWMKKTGVPAVEDKIGDGSSVVIMMGFNDVFTQSVTEDYADYLNDKAADWVADGANVYFVSVNPITTESVANGQITNAKIEKWNAAIEKLLSKDITYLDTYSLLKGKLSAGDGIHYYADDCQTVYDTVLELIESGEELNEAEAKELEEFQTEITSAERNTDDDTITIKVTKPEDIKNVYYQVACYNDEEDKWETVAKTKTTTITFDADEDDMKLRVRAYKKYSGETVKGKWSEKITVDADGTMKQEKEHWWVRLYKWFIGLFS